ncbi:hypothetical protein QUA81_13790 [Microcoleus sp. F6_B4]
MKIKALTATGLTETIQDTRHALDRSRNKKPVSDDTCRTYLSRASQFFNLKSQISNLKSRNRLTIGSTRQLFGITKNGTIARSPKSQFWAQNPSKYRAELLIDKCFFSLTCYQWIKGKQRQPTIRRYPVVKKGFYRPIKTTPRVPLI